MTVAEATPDFEQGDHDDRAFLGHPKGLGYLGFTEACERFSYYSMQTLLALYMVNYLLLPGHIEKRHRSRLAAGWHYPGLDGQPLSSAIFGDYTSLVYLMPILGGIIADKLTGRRIALIAGGAGDGARPFPDGDRGRVPVRAAGADRRRRPVQGQYRDPGRRALRPSTTCAARWRSRSSTSSSTSA